MDGFEKENNVYTNPDLGSEDNFAIALLKGILGAIVGAIPGFALWLIIAKLGYVSSLCGAVIAIGSAFGFSFMTKKSSISPFIAIITCIIVMAGAVYLAIRIDWAWEIAKVFEETVWPEFKELMSVYGISNSETKELYEMSLNEELGFSELNFANCFSKLSMLIEYLDLKSEYTMELVKGGACALLGVVVLFKGLKK
ncbi:MAG: hypothetical protein J6K17_10470 [Oscillospiraceae bacterium]|nr:hypothetical protein [Oscillospiraceae bacterium]